MRNEWYGVFHTAWHQNVYSNYLEPIFLDYCTPFNIAGIFILLLEIGTKFLLCLELIYSSLVATQHCWLTFYCCRHDYIDLHLIVGLVASTDVNFIVGQLASIDLHLNVSWVASIDLNFTVGMLASIYLHFIVSVVAGTDLHVLLSLEVWTEGCVFPRTSRVHRRQQQFHMRFSYLYGGHPVVFITKQVTHIHSNTTKVYLNSSYLYMYATCFDLYVGHLLSTQNSYKGRDDKNLRGPCFSHYFYNIKT
jgi:hypothetical protein